MDVCKALAQGEKVSERDFDLIFPSRVRKLSRVHWTPLTAALRAVELLVTKPGDKVLDIGSGAGKLCIVGSLATHGSFTGVEKDAELVRIARQITHDHHIPRTRFVQGDALTQDWNAFDALYLFNPFANDVAITKDHLRNRAVREEDFIHLVERASAKLAALPQGIRVVTYHGFGGQMPENLVEQRAEIVGPGILQLWVAG